MCASSPLVFQQQRFRQPWDLLRLSHIPRSAGRTTPPPLNARNQTTLLVCILHSYLSSHVPLKYLPVKTIHLKTSILGLRMVWSEVATQPPQPRFERARAASGARHSLLVCNTRQLDGLGTVFTTVGAAKRTARTDSQPARSITDPRPVGRAAHNVLQRTSLRILDEQSTGCYSTMGSGPDVSPHSGSDPCADVGERLG